MKRFFFSAIISFLLVLSYSCKSEIDTKNFTHAVVKTDLFDIRVSDTTDISFLKNDFNDGVLYGLQKNTIVKVDLKAKKIASNIKIPDFYISSKLSSIHVISKDSILVTDTEQSFLLINDKGDVLNSYSITDTNVLPEDSQIFSIIPHIRLQENQQNVYFPVLHYAYLVKPWEYQNSNRIGVLNLASEKVTQFMIPTAKSAALEKGHNYPNDVMEPNLTVVNDHILVSYPYDDTVEVFDLSGKFKFRKKITSQYIPETPKPMKKETYEVRQKNWNYRITMPFYDNINFHKDIRLYSRIAYHEQPLKMSNGKLNNGSNRSASIILMDTEFNIIGETLFENGSLGIYKSIPLPDGYLIAPNEQYWKYEDQLVYTTKYTIEKL